MRTSQAFIEIKRILTDELSFDESKKALNYISCYEDFSFNETFNILAMISRFLYFLVIKRVFINMLYEAMLDLLS